MRKNFLYWLLGILLWTLGLPTLFAFYLMSKYQRSANFTASVGIPKSDIILVGKFFLINLIALLFVGLIYKLLRSSKKPDDE